MLLLKLRTGAEVGKGVLLRSARPPRMRCGSRVKRGTKQGHQKRAETLADCRLRACLELTPRKANSAYAVVTTLVSVQAPNPLHTSGIIRLHGCRDTVMSCFMPGH